MSPRTFQVFVHTWQTHVIEIEADSAVSARLQAQEIQEHSGLEKFTIFAGGVEDFECEEVA